MRPSRAGRWAVGPACGPVPSAPAAPSSGATCYFPPLLPLACWHCEMAADVIRQRLSLHPCLRCGRASSATSLLPLSWLPSTPDHLHVQLTVKLSKTSAFLVHFSHLMHLLLYPTLLWQRIFGGRRGQHGVPADHAGARGASPADGRSACAVVQSGGSRGRRGQALLRGGGTDGGAGGGRRGPGPSGDGGGHGRGLWMAGREVIKY